MIFLLKREKTEKEYKSMNLHNQFRINSAKTRLSAFHLLGEPFKNGGSAPYLTSGLNGWGRENVLLECGQRNRDHAERLARECTST
jgi:hypothetical protein